MNGSSFWLRLKSFAEGYLRDSSKLSQDSEPSQHTGEWALGGGGLYKGVCPAKITLVDNSILCHYYIIIISLFFVFF